MLRIGCHLSTTKGFLAMGKTALGIGATTLQFFTRNPRGGSAKALDPKDVAAFHELARQHNLTMLAHAAYTLNPCSPKAEVRDFALRTMTDDLDRLRHFPGTMYNFHPGSHVDQGTDTGIGQIIDQLNQVLAPEGETVVLLETMAGKGSEVGGSFGELRRIIDAVDRQERLGVCLDTCHVHDAGYDIVNDLDGVLCEFDDTIGLDRLQAIHLNDSLNPRGARKDRHAKIGQGHIGLDAFVRIINHPRLRDLPFYLETPNELPGYAEEIRLLREHWR